MQLVQHVGSQVEGTGDKIPASTQGLASGDVHVHLHSGCSLCPLAVPRLELGMDTFENLCAHLLQIVLRMKLPQSYHIVVRPLCHPDVQDDI